ncbi:unnamed protein product, partial [marine sediment metagenome]
FFNQSPLDKIKAKDSHATSTSFLKYGTRGLTKGS